MIALSPHSQSQVSEATTCTTITVHVPLHVPVLRLYMCHYMWYSTQQLRTSESASSRLNTLLERAPRSKLRSGALRITWESVGRGVCRIV